MDFLQFNVGAAVTDNTNNTLPTRLVGGNSAKRPTATSVRRINMFEMNAGAMNWWMGLDRHRGGDWARPGRAGRWVPGPDQTAWNANTFHQEIGERPAEGSVQEWDFVNNTADSHPMHMHLVQFQVVHRRASAPRRWGTEGTRSRLGAGLEGHRRGPPRPVTRVRAKFDLPTPAAVVHRPVSWRPGRATTTCNATATRGPEAKRCFVYHCHILEHEENDMMRPFLIT